MEQAIREIVAEQLGLDASTIDIDAQLILLGADSLDMVEMAMTLEDVLDLEFPDEEFERVTTVRQAVDMANSMLAVRQGASNG